MYASSVPNDIHFYHQNRIYQCHICSWEIPYCSSNCLCVDWLSYGIFVDEIWWEFSVQRDMIWYDNSHLPSSLCKPWSLWISSWMKMWNPPVTTINVNTDCNPSMNGPKKLSSLLRHIQRRKDITHIPQSLDVSSTIFLPLSSLINKS